MNPFEKFPRTPHLLWLGNDHPRDDKVLSDVECASFLKHFVIIEEKVDGANVGISMDMDGNLRAQNRGTVLESGKTDLQFEPFWAWLAMLRDSLISVLGNKYAVFGEWCFARHSVYYASLPDWFLGFDVLDRQQNAFLDTRGRNSIFQRIGMDMVPYIAQGVFSRTDVIGLLHKASSMLGAPAPEGLYLRKESNGKVTSRAKLVHPEFHINLGEHWSKRPLEKNRLRTQANIQGRSAPIPHNP